MNNKKFLIAVLSLILLFTVSCNEDKTGGGRVSPTSPETDSGISPSSPADGGGETIYNVVGIWMGTDEKGQQREAIKIEEGNKVSFPDTKDGWEPPITATRNGNTYTVNVSNIGEVNIIFTSNTTGKIEIPTTGNSVNITKKPQ